MNYLSEEYFQVVDAENADVADAAALAGCQYLDIAPTAIEIISERDAVMQLQDRAVGFISHSVDELKVPHGNIHRVAESR